MWGAKAEFIQQGLGHKLCIIKYRKGEDYLYKNGGLYRL